MKGLLWVLDARQPLLNMQSFLNPTGVTRLGLHDRRFQYNVSNPGFARWTADERIKEVEPTGAESIVTACPHFKGNLQDAVEENDSALKVHDIVQLLEESDLIRCTYFSGVTVLRE